MRALLSVSDKRGVAEFAAALAGRGYELVSTGGTAATLRSAGLTVVEAGDLSGFGEILDGRVKTLHPAIHGGLLADLGREGHARQLEEAGIAPIDIAVINLYPFEATIAGPHTLAEAIENIDIGGPAMIRAAAKNASRVTVVVDPDDYDRVLAALGTAEIDSLRRELMAKAFRHTAFYDSLIGRYLGQAFGLEELSETLTVGYRRERALRYGENPHQQAAWYRDPLGTAGIGRAEVAGGKAPSYNNLLDAEAAWELVSDLPPRSCVIVKHGNPCGAASGATLAEAYRRAWGGDPISAFGGIVAFNEPIDLSAAEAMTEKGNFLEVVIAPGWTPEVEAIFEAKPGWGPNVRLVKAVLSPAEADVTMRTIRGGLLAQSGDEEPGRNWRVVSARTPSEAEMAALRLAWTVAMHVKSNAIVVSSAERVLGVGAGQMNRVQSTRLALAQAGELAKGAALASDGFFPFADSIEVAAEAGIAALVEPGGSKKDDEVIAEADKRGLALLFTDVRHFRH